MRRTIVIECQSCEGTGLYVGMSEHNGAAVVCHSCKGTGKMEFSYNEFEGRKEKEGVTRVFHGMVMYMHSGTDVTTDEGKVLHFSKYGCSYDEWKNGKTPAPMEELYCPHMYDNRGIGNEPCSRCERDINKAWGRDFRSCEFFDDKAKCWEEWHKNND